MREPSTDVQTQLKSLRLNGMATAWADPGDEPQLQQALMQLRATVQTLPAPSHG